MSAPITLTSPLPAKDLLFAAMEVSSGLSRLDEIELELLSERSDIDPAALLGKPLGVHVTLRDGAKRHFHGHIVRFGMARPQGRRHGWRASVRPWPWFLTRTTDCRIFQDMTVPEIVKAVFADHPVADFEMKLVRSYRQWIYCVQYRETDLDFVARLLEHEGIYWYLRHDASRHTLVLADDAGAHAAAPSCKTLDYYEAGDQAPPDTPYVQGWSFAQGVSSGAVALTSFDFERPSAKLDVLKQRSRSHEQAAHELFDYANEYIVKDDGAQYATNRLDEAQTGFETMQGDCNAQGLETGRLFMLARHPRGDQNAQYLVTAQTLHATLAAYEASDASTEWRCSFTAIPAKQQYRPPRLTRKPFVRGPQTAIVTGPGGAEIHTDKYGRVKVQFHWDRRGRHDDKSSCWVRVSHPWAGKNFGAVHVPRIGQEVIVDFIEGDPDQPIITGRVYNAEQMPPWELPGSATQSGILSRSSAGGAYANANAIRFEDKAGEEQLWIHAERNQDIEVEKDETHWVGQDRKKTIDRDETNHIKQDRTETVDRDETITVHGKRTEIVDKDETITIHGQRSETVDKDETITIKGARTETVTKDESITIDGARTEKVAKDESITIQGGRTEKVTKDESITIDGGRTKTVAKDETTTIKGGRTETVTKDEGVTIQGGRTVSVTKDDGLTVQGARTVSITKDDGLSVGKKLTVTAADSISFTTGEASLTMEKNGTITLKGKKITIDGSDVSNQCSGKFNVKASSDVTLKGSKILQN